MNKLKLWWVANGAETLAGALIVMAVVSMFIGASFAAVVLLHQDNPGAQTCGVIDLLVEVAAIIFLFNRD